MPTVEFRPLEYSPEAVLKYAERPERSTTAIPDWFKSAPRYQNNDKEMISDEHSHNLTVRHCMPFLDAMTSGYILTTSTDIYVTRNENYYPSISFGENSQNLPAPQIQFNPNFETHVPLKPGFDSFVYAWSVYWRIKTPKGVSSIFTQPLNKTDLPFHTLTGITDTDSWDGSDVLNVALAAGFQGTIPKGTPFVQIIPFYREDWDHKIIEENFDEDVSLREKVAIERTNSKSGYYRDNLWNKKTYR